MLPRRGGAHVSDQKCKRHARMPVAWANCLRLHGFTWSPHSTSYLDTLWYIRHGSGAYQSPFRPLHVIDTRLGTLEDLLRWCIQNQPKP